METTQTQTKQMTFVDWWKSLAPSERDAVTIELSQRCNTALLTVLSWGNGSRSPRARAKEIIVKYLYDKNINLDSENLFPN